MFLVSLFCLKKQFKINIPKVSFKVTELWSPSLRNQDLGAYCYWDLAQWTKLGNICIDINTNLHIYV